MIVRKLVSQVTMVKSTRIQQPFHEELKHSQNTVFRLMTCLGSRSESPHVRSIDLRIASCAATPTSQAPPETLNELPPGFPSAM